MGARGPKPKSPALRKAQGNPGRKKISSKGQKLKSVKTPRRDSSGRFVSRKPASTSGPKIVMPSCPNHLSGDAKREWRRLVPLLAELGIISRLDRTTLAAHCEAYGLFCKAARKLKKEGLVVEVGDNGYRQQSPWLGIYNNAIAQMQKYIRELGLSPAAREALAIDTSAIDIPKPKKPSAKQQAKLNAKDLAAASLEDMIRAGGTPAGGRA